MLEYQKLNDSELTDLVRKSDELAFAEIYQRYWTIMYMQGCGTGAVYHLMGL